VKKPAVEETRRSSGLGETLRGIDQYWFGYGSPVSMAVFRILFGTLAFINLLMISVDFEAWFTERGYTPLQLAEAHAGRITSQYSLFGYQFDLGFNPPRLNLLSGVADERITAAVYILTMVFALLTALGLWSRLSSIALAVGIVSLHHRNMAILHGGDTVLRVGVLYVALAPSGLACSLDRLIGLWKGTAPPEPRRVSLWPQRLMSFNVALVYFTTFWHKLGFGSHWKDLTATWYPARLNEFDRFPVPAVFDDVPAIYVSTFFTLAVELSLGTLVFYRPARRYVLFAGLMMHAFIEYSMNIPLFAFLICSMYVSFYEGDEVTEWAKRMGHWLRRYKATVSLPAGVRFRPGPELALKGVNAFDLVEYVPGETESWHAVNAKGQPVPAPRASWTRSPGACLVGWMPGLWKRVLNAATEPAPTPEKEASPEPGAKPRTKVRR
jgi:hypothetical protein